MTVGIWSRLVWGLGSVTAANGTDPSGDKQDLRVPSLPQQEFEVLLVRPAFPLKGPSSLEEFVRQVVA